MIRRWLHALAHRCHCNRIRVRIFFFRGLWFVGDECAACGKIEDVDVLTPAEASLVKGVLEYRRGVA